MPNVEIVVSHAGHWHDQKWLIDEEICKKRSATLKREIEQAHEPEDGSPKRVVVFGSVGPMTVMLNAIRDFGNSKNFKVHHARLPDAHVAMLWEVSEILGITPEQVHLRIRLRYWISHRKLSIQDVVTVHRIFYATRDVRRPDEPKTIWEVLVHHTAWNLDAGQYTAQEMAAMDSLLDEQHPVLLDAIRSKITKLQQGRATAEREHQNTQQRHEAKKINRRVAEYKADQRRQKDEELQGDVRELSEGMAQHMLSRPPPVWEAKVQEGKHGRRNRPGEGRRSKKVQAETKEEEADDGKGGWTKV